MTIRTYLAAAAVAAVASTGLATLGTAAEMGAVDEPIKLAINEWTGQHISTHIAGEVLQRMGYKVEYVTAGYYPQMQALTDGSISATMEIWSSNIGENAEKAMATGNVEVIGDLGLVPREAWMYIAHTEEVCPGLPDWEALNDCADKIAAAETFPKGRFLDYPADWGTTNVDRISSLGMNLKSIPAGSEGALIAEIKSAAAAKTPLVLMFWEPHWVHAQYDMKIVELPKYEPACYEDASWGLNPDATYDCDWDDTAHIDKMGWIGLKDKWPAAHAALQAFKLTNSQQAAMMYAVDVEGQKIEKVVGSWLDANEAIWKPWTE